MLLKVFFCLEVTVAVNSASCNDGRDYDMRREYSWQALEQMAIAFFHYYVSHEQKADSCELQCRGNRGLSIT